MDAAERGRLLFKLAELVERDIVYLAVSSLKLRAALHCVLSEPGDSRQRQAVQHRADGLPDGNHGAEVLRRVVRQDSRQHDPDS